LSDTADVSGVTIATAGFRPDITAARFTSTASRSPWPRPDTLQQVFDKIATATGNAVTAGYDPTTDKITLTRRARWS